MLFLGLAVAMALAQSPVRSTWDGVYTAAQARSGQLTYSENCERCHRADLSGYGGVLMGSYFLESWRDEGLDKFFGLMKRVMPQGKPGSLSDQQYIDIVAYVLWFNRFPEGGKELTATDLHEVVVAGKEGPDAILDFGTLVKVSGCLVQNGPQRWTVVRGSAPVKTKDPDDSSGPELAAATAQPPGGQTFRLQDSGFFHPERSKDHFVEAKGFLTKQPDGGKLFVTSIQTIGGACSADNDDMNLARPVHAAHQQLLNIGGAAGSGDEDRGTGVIGGSGVQCEQFVQP